MPGREGRRGTAGTARNLLVDARLCRSCALDHGGDPKDYVRPERRKAWRLFAEALVDQLAHSEREPQVDALGLPPAEVSPARPCCQSALRPDAGPPRRRGKQTYQLHPAGYQFAAGHSPKLEILGRDFPYMQERSGEYEVRVRKLRVELPVRDEPDGQVKPFAPPR